MIPIAKSSAKSDPGNYRPISLTSILCKILEKHICGLIELHLSTFHPLSDHQWGFRASKSTVDALLTVTQEWCSALDTGKEVAAVFFDYKKAFDSVPHQPLIRKLEGVDLNPVILTWVKDYLANHSQYVVVNGASSQLSAIVSGVPQGSVLGPLLFIIYINYLMEQELMAGSVLHVYADDILLYRTITPLMTSCHSSLILITSQHDHVQISLPSTATSASSWFCLDDGLPPIQSYHLQ